MRADDGHSTRVGLVATAADAALVTEIVAGLRDLGVDAAPVTGQTTESLRAVVVLISPSSLADAEWHARVEATRDARLVAARVSPVDDDLVPDHLRAINWVIRKPDSSGFIPKLFTAINTNLERYRDSQEVRSQAARWEDAGRTNDFLIDSVTVAKARIREARAALAIDPGALSALAQDFLAESDRFARRLRRGRIFSATWRLALAIVVVVSVVSSVSSIIDAVRRSNNSVGLAVPAASSLMRPDITAFKAGASLLDSEDFAADDARFHIMVETLSYHWSLGYLALPGDFLVYDHVMLADSETTRAISSFGALVQWGPDGQVEWVRQVASEQLQALDVSPDGSLNAVVTAGAVTFVHSDDWSTASVPLAGGSSVALSADSNRAIVAVGSELWAIDDIDSVPSAALRLGAWDAVLNVQQFSDGSAGALVRDGDDLVVVSDSGIAGERIAIPPGTRGITSLSPDGDDVAMIVAQTIWTSNEGGPFVNSGLTVAGIPSAMELTAAGLVLISDRTDGIRLDDPALGIVLGAPCGFLPSATQFAIAPDDDNFVCIGGSMNIRDRIGELRPSESTTAAAPQREAVGSGDDSVQSVRIVEGFVEVTPSHGDSVAFDVVGAMVSDGATGPEEIANDILATGALLGVSAQPTTVAIAPGGDTFAIGTEDGTVVEVDVDSTGAIALVSTYRLPDHLAVTGIDWSEGLGEVTVASAGGMSWTRPSCAGCYNTGRIFDVVRQQAWLCYETQDADELGITARRSFDLRDCRTAPEVIGAP